MGLSDVVNVVVTTQNPGVTEQGFGIPLILSHSASWVERTRTYNSIAAVGADFATTTPEYAAANKIFSQSPSVPTIMIGRAALKPTQRYAVGVVAAAAGYDYELRMSDGGASQTATATSTASAAWQATHAYVRGDLVTNDTGKLYVCITAGTSAGSGGPTGTSADITDGSAHWMYAGAGGSGVASNDQIAYLLKLAIDAFSPSMAVTTSLQGSAGSKTLRVLANASGTFFGAEVLDRALLSIAQDHADPGVATDLAAVLLESSAWYGLLTLFNSSALVLAAAAWVESAKRLYDADTLDTEVATHALSGATDVAAALKSAAYARTHCFFHPANDDFAAAAEMGKFFPVSPGGDNWRLKTLTGVTVKQFTDTEATNIKAKYAGYYADLGGVSVIQGDGKVAANEYVDVIRGIDWWTARTQTRLVNLLIQNNKVPFTDAGISRIAAEVRAQNSEGIEAGLIAEDPAPTVTTPKASAVSSSDRVNRQLNDVNTSWTLAGAINKLTVNAQVSA